MKIMTIAALAGSLLLTGCMGAMSVPVQPPVGGLFTHYKAPLSVELNDVSAAKSGEATTEYLNIPFFGSWSFSWGDGSVKTAAANGNISEVQYSDYEFFNVLGIYSKYTTRVYGD